MSTALPSALEAVVAEAVEVEGLVEAVEEAPPPQVETPKRRRKPRNGPDEPGSRSSTIRRKQRKRKPRRS